MTTIFGFVEKIATHPLGIEAAWVENVREEEWDAAARSIKDWLDKNCKPQSNPVTNSKPLVWRTKYVHLYGQWKLNTEQSYNLYRFFNSPNHLLVRQPTRKERIEALIGQLKQELEEL